MKKLQEEFEKFTYPATKCGCGEMHFPYRFKNDCSPNEVWNWINQNYISKEEILNLECLKEERHNNWQGCGKPVESCYVCDRNQLRKEIIDEIKKIID